MLSSACLSSARVTGQQRVHGHVTPPPRSRAVLRHAHTQCCTSPKFLWLRDKGKTAGQILRNAGSTRRETRFFPRGRHSSRRGLRMPSHITCTAFRPARGQFEEGACDVTSGTAIKAFASPLCKTKDGQPDRQCMYSSAYSSSRYCTRRHTSARR